MNEFEKWAGPGFYYGKDPLNRPTLDAKRKTWKAAFENIQQWIMGRRCTGEDVLEYIIKELEN